MVKSSLVFAFEVMVPRAYVLALISAAFALSACGHCYSTGQYGQWLVGESCAPSYTGPSGPQYQAAQLNGTNAYAQVTGVSIPVDGTNQFTVEMYFQPTSVAGNWVQYSDNTGLTMTVDSTFTSNKFGVGTPQNANVGMCSTGGGTGWMTSVSAPNRFPVASTLYHIAMTYDNSTKFTSLYVNGVNQNTGVLALSGSQAGCTINTINLGANATPANFMTGIVGDLRISNSLRYTADFTPPTGQLQQDGNTVLLVHFGGSNPTGFNPVDFALTGTPQWQLIGGANLTVSPF